MANAMLEKIPAMSDGDLASLFANAQRLSETGSMKQKGAANELLPALTAETTARKDAKSAAAADRLARSRKAKAKPKPKAAVEALGDAA